VATISANACVCSHVQYHMWLMRTLFVETVAARSCVLSTVAILFMAAGSLQYMDPNARCGKRVAMFSYGT
jgi:hypothetical protein